MALLRNNLSLKMKGRAGAYTFYSSKGRQVARVSQNSSNYGESARRSLAQQTRRVKWSNLVNFYKLTAGYLHGAFESKRSNETDYNAFMRKNLAIASVALTKDMAARNCCVPQNFYISEGSLHTPDYHWGGPEGNENFYLGLAADEDGSINDMDVAQLTAVLIRNNPFLREGMQISIFAVTCDQKLGDPHSSLRAWEITLDSKDTRSVSIALPHLTIVADEDAEINITNLTSDAYMAVVISDSTSGSLKVSSATLLKGDDEAEEALSTDAAVAAAIASYGLDADRFLDSGDYQG